MKSILYDNESTFSGTEEMKTEHVEGSPPLIDYTSLRDYERFHNPDELARAVLTMENESVLIRRSFRWWKDGVTMPNAHAKMGLDEVCEANGWKIVASFGHHLAIVAPTHACP